MKGSGLEVQSSVKALRYAMLCVRESLGQNAFFLFSKDIYAA